MKDPNQLNLVQEAAVRFWGLNPLARAFITIAGGIAITTILAACGEANTATAVHTQIASTPTALPTAIPYSLHNPLILDEAVREGVCTIQSINGVGVKGFPDAIQDGALLDVLCDGIKNVFELDYSEMFHRFTNWLIHPNLQADQLGEVGTELIPIPQNANIICGVSPNIAPFPGAVEVSATLGDGSSQQYVAEILTTGTNSTTTYGEAFTSAQRIPLIPTVLEGTENGVVTEGYRSLALFYKQVVDGVTRLLYAGNLINCSPLYKTR